MFERFTDAARDTIVFAQEEARARNHDYIGTEHLLLALVREREGSAAAVLAGLEIDGAAVREQIDAAVGPGKRAPSGHIPFTCHAKRALELALREALELGDNFIGSQHLLLGLIQEGEGVAGKLLAGLGADLEQARQQTLALGRSERSGAPEGPSRDFGLSLSAARLDGVEEMLREVLRRLEAIERHLDERED